jgi:cell division protein FtsW (lipid II flippase)
LYSLGGFTLPFISVGSVTLLVAILLLIIVPNIKMEEKDKTDGGKSLTFAGLLKVNLAV